MEIKYKLESYGCRPRKAHEADAGFDILSPDEFILNPHSSVIIKTGLHMEIPEGYCGVLMSKSGLNVKYGITSEGVIDSGYTGEIVVKLYNSSDSKYVIERQDKITQMLILPVPKVNLRLTHTMQETERGDGGFGSTGR